MVSLRQTTISGIAFLHHRIAPLHEIHRVVASALASPRARPLLDVDVDSDTSSTITTTDGDDVDIQRRRMFSMIICTSILPMYQVNARDVDQANPSYTSENLPGISSIYDEKLRNYSNPHLPNWKGTALTRLSLSDAASQITNQMNMQTNTSPTLPMGRWPDPILRHSSSPVSSCVFNNDHQLKQLQLVARALRNTARKEGAVGLAAQQCGVDGSLVFIDGIKKTHRSINQQLEMSFGELLDGAFGQRSWRNSKKEVSGEGAYDDDIFAINKLSLTKQQPQREAEGGVFLVNPRIVHRSTESEMLVWTEECLVLPPVFRATLVRDAEVTIEYESLETLDESSPGDSLCGVTKQITLKGELARCAQHEMDHDRGVLIVDHVGLNELLSIAGDSFMADIENSDGLHEERIERAFSREVSESTLLPSAGRNVPLAFENYREYHTKVTNVQSNSNLDKRPWFVQPSSASEEGVTSSKTIDKRPLDPNTTARDCDNTCMEERKRIIAERRAMMKQSRSNTNRGDVLKLSEQRATLYGTSYSGLPSSACTIPEFCP
ncbi:predicted protein [Thalassiosira pseudonana CCMP1335]|uniref:Peptide deformylase n=1 Tax=Thalassiosira pseudonana TaxID=35128 RepID=B8CD34_THAPS|nr:predicted protein [Thalassiosira pseudonana CCMP1335]EED88398.1 predicted protein [Thalassiosira pseudonana CCMP1335]